MEMKKIIIFASPTDLSQKTTIQFPACHELIAYFTTKLFNLLQKLYKKRHHSIFKRKSYALFSNLDKGVLYYVAVLLAFSF